MKNNDYKDKLSNLIDLIFQSNESINDFNQEDFKKLLLGTAQQESLMGLLSKSDPMQINSDGFIKEAYKSPYSDILENTSDLEKNLALAMLRYIYQPMSTSSGIGYRQFVPASTPEGQAAQWAQLYNIAGAGMGYRRGNKVPGLKEKTQRNFIVNYPE